MIFEIWDGALFLFTCTADEADMYAEQGFSIVSYNQ
jgi:hypothetical protein